MQLVHEEEERTFEITKVFGCEDGSVAEGVVKYNTKTGDGAYLTARVSPQTGPTL